MSDKNQILEEQRRAREEFLKLKKMQSGEIDAGPKPSEVAIVPKTAKEKRANFWFHYKWHTIAVIFTAVLLTILITQCSSRVKYDYKIVYFTYTPVLDAQTENIAEFIKTYADDVNGDGEVNVQLINCSISNKSSAVQYNNAIYSKLTSMIVADKDILLFITDKESINYFNDLGSESGGVFEDEPYDFTQKFYDEFYKKYSESLPEGLQISCRKVKGTALEGEDIAEEAFLYAEKLFNNFKKADIIDK